MRRNSNEKALVFDTPKDTGSSEGLGSSIRIESAGKLTAGRSKTIQCLHKSEKAFWKNAATVQSGLLQSVPHKANTIVIDESTANGVSGDGEQFYNDWWDSDYINIFFKWTDNPEYEATPELEFKKTDYERYLIDLHPELTDRKLAFRRWKIKNDMGSATLNPEDQFKQEYPLSEHEAFISTGRSVFNLEKVRRDIERIKDLPFTRGRFDSEGRFVEDYDGEIKVFSKPVPGKPYSIGSDVAEGLETGDGSTFSVFDKNMEQIASYYGKIAPDLLGKLLVQAGVYWNHGILVPEINNHGHATLAKIKDLQYHNVFSREVQEEHGVGITRKIGWQTNSKTKMKMLDDFVAAYRDDLINIKDVDLLREMMTLVVEPDGNVTLNGKDRVVAACLALQGLPKMVVPGQFKATVPGKAERAMDVTKLSLEDRLKYYKNRDKGRSSFG
jgi:hypothetical protein